MVLNSFPKKFTNSKTLNEYLLLHSEKKDLIKKYYIALCEIFISQNAQKLSQHAAHSGLCEFLTQNNLTDTLKIGIDLNKTKTSKLFLKQISSMLDFATTSM